MYGNERIEPSENIDIKLGTKADFTLSELVIKRVHARR